MAIWFPYVMLFIRCLCSTLSSGFIKKYQQTAPEGNVTFCVYSMIMSACAMLYYFILGGFRVEMNLATLWYVLVTGVDMVVIVVLGIVAMRYTDLLTLSFSQSCGNMLLPVLFGILFLNEQTKITFWFSAALMVFAVIFPIATKWKQRERSTVIGYIMCIILFFVNGFYTVLNKMYQANPITCNETSFCFMINVVMFVMSLAAFPILLKTLPAERQNIRLLKPKHILLILAGTLCTNTGALINFVVMAGMNLSLMTVLGTSLSIIGTVVLSVAIFRERKLGTVDAISIFCALASVALGAL